MKRRNQRFRGRRKKPLHKMSTLAVPSPVRRAIQRNRREARTFYLAAVKGGLDE